MEKTRLSPEQRLRRYLDNAVENAEYSLYNDRYLMGCLEMLHDLKTDMPWLSYRILREHITELKRWHKIK